MKKVIGCKLSIFFISALTASIGLVFSCSKLHFSPWYCENDSHCEHYGSADLLFKEPLDLLIVLDNREKMKTLNSWITVNMNQMLQCIHPIDWKAGFISAVNRKESFGHLMSMEADRLLSSKKYLTQQENNYAQIFHDSLSIQSGCSSPPYCYKGKLQPLGAVEAFMKNTRQKNLFLREQSPLSVIFISSSGKQKKSMFSAKPAGGKELMAAVMQNSYYTQKPNHFMSFAVLPLEGSRDCAAENILVKGAEGLSHLGSAYGWAVMDPLALITTAVIKNAVKKFKDRRKSLEIAQFARQSGGQALNLCSPHFGKALAYMLFQQLSLEEKFPKECRSVPVVKE